MSEFKVGDRVITQWGEEARELGLNPEDISSTEEHTILAIHDNDGYLDPGCSWYPLSLMTQVIQKKDGDDRLRDECAMMAMQGDWAAQNEEGGYYTNSTDMEFLVKRAELYYRMADAMLEARKK
jgi:hypothetical protein